MQYCHCPGCTILVQPLDVVFNGPFKRAVDTIATSHVEAHVDDYLHGNFTASERRILLTKWIGQAWEEVSANKDMVIRGFWKCGISIAIDGSEDNEINIKDLENYEIESDDDDPFATSDDDDSSSDGNSPGSGDEKEHNEEGCDDEDCDNNHDVPFTVPFNSITNEEWFPSLCSNLDYCVDLDNLVEDNFIAC